jgi:hypothetical protein
MNRLAALVVASVCCPVGTAQAQAPRPIPAFVVDARGGYPGMGRDPVTASGLGQLATSLPGRGLAGTIGVHVYPLRGRRMALGLGGDFVLIRGRAVETDAATGLTTAVVRQRYQSLSGTVSLNFGHRDGWSYLSAGMGPATFASHLGDLRPAETPSSKATLHMGGGGRWFFSNHFAFTFDVRFHQTRPELPTTAYPGRQRVRLTVISAGISIR